MRFRFSALTICLFLLSGQINLFANQKFDSPATYQIESRTVKGLVTDGAGVPIPGVNVVIKGTTTGVVTGSDGSYSISVPNDEAVLVFSFIGFVAQEVSVGNQTQINITLSEDTREIEEVVVVGYGTQRKVTVTGSVTSVSGNELAPNPVVSLSNSFAGRLPGVIANTRSGEPGEDVASILIRGRSTTGNTSPLIVIDGVAGRGGLDQINAEDIESISVLKDASAAIYGARAANGVILITTKRGTSQKPTVSYSYNQGFIQPTRLPELADAALYAEAVNDQRLSMGQSIMWTDEEVQKFRDGSDPQNYPNTDWIKETVRKVSTQSRQSLSIRGGNDAVRYYLSGNYSNQDGIFKNGNTNYRLLGMRSSVDAAITKDINIGLRFVAQQRQRTSPGVGNQAAMNSTFLQFPVVHAYYPNGLPGIGSMGFGRNPVIMHTDQTGYRKITTNLYQTTVTLDVKIPWVEGLSVDGFVAYDRSYQHDKHFRKNWTTYTYDKVTDTYTAVRSGEWAAPDLREKADYSNSLTLNAKLKYERVFDQHRLNAFIAFEQSQSNSNNFEGFRQNYASDAVDQLFAGGENDQQTTGAASETARRNYFGRVSYGYKDRYLLDFTFRADGSFNFPSNKRWGYFPGVSVGWRISEESFIKESAPFISNLKIRGSWGEMGNDNVSAFQYLATYAFRTTPATYFGANADPVKGLVRGVNPNPNITWEVARTTNIGLDAEFWSGKLGVVLDLFKTKRNNILAARNASIPAYAGLSLPNENIGVVENKGFELELSHLNHNISAGWHYSVSANMSFARNKIIDIDEAQNINHWQMQTGHILGTRLLYIAEGIYRSQEEIDNSPHPANTIPGDIKYKDVSGDGNISAADQVRLDKTETPEIMFGLNLTAGYKNFDLSVLFQGQARAWINCWKPSGDRGSIYLDLAENYYHPTKNPNSKYPNLTYQQSQISGYPSTFWIEDASYIRLKTLEIGYTIPKHIVSKIKLQNCRIYLNGYNLFTIDKNKWYDPEAPWLGGDSFYYPQTKVYNVGINLTF